MGGASSEADVSRRSGKAVADGLRAAGYDVVAVDLQDDRLPALPEGCEAVFIAMHGSFGEDGQVQALLDARGVPYTGSGAAASARAFDKIASKCCFEAAGVSTPAYVVVDNGVLPTLPLPFVVKPACQGSSIGVHIVTDGAEWGAAWSDARQYGTVLVEAYVPGSELTVGIVDGEALPVVQIVAPDDNYDFRAKYLSGETQYRVPAPLAAEVLERCQALAKRVYTALGCRGFGRVDIRLRPDGALFVLEMNTIPGFTATSLLPKAAQAAGLGFPVLCERILNTAACGA